MAIEIRVTEPHEYRAASRVKEIALLQNVTDDEGWAKRVPSWDDTMSWSAWDGSECVGHAGYFTSDTTIVGGARLPTGLVTRVGVLPTARRQGVATRLMNQITVDAAQRGLVMMSLRASEAVIYERYGYGVAGDFCTLKIDPRRARPLRGAETDGSFRYLKPDEILSVLPELYDRVARGRVGTIARPASIWTMYFSDATELGHDEHVVVHYDAAGNPDGYVQYDATWPEPDPERGRVHDLFGANEAVELALWQFICDIDLVQQWTADERPVDDLIRLAAHDRRAVTYAAIDDEQWLRLIDVDTALASRTYAAATGTVTIAVSDPFIESNNGVWEIAASGATRLPGADLDDADIVAPIEVVSAAFLGGPTWSDLVATTGATAKSADALNVADTLFHSPQAPFCGSFF